MKSQNILQKRYSKKRGNFAQKNVFSDHKFSLSLSPLAKMTVEKINE